MYHLAIFSLAVAPVLHITLEGSFERLCWILYELLNWFLKIQTIHCCVKFSISSMLWCPQPEISLSPLHPTHSLCNIIHQYCPLNPIIMQTRGLHDTCQLDSFVWVCWILWTFKLICKHADNTCLCNILNLVNAKIENHWCRAFQEAIYIFSLDTNQ